MVMSCHNLVMFAFIINLKVPDAVELTVACTNSSSAVVSWRNKGTFLIDNIHVEYSCHNESTGKNV